MTVEVAPPGISAKRVLGLFVCVLLIGVGLAWAFLSMRAVMGVGGSCASGGPYEIANPCPDGAWLISIALPMMLLSAFAGTMVATGLSAPNLLLPMWGLVFGSLGWNFLEFGLFRGDVEVGWIVCGVMFELMALPVVFLAWPAKRKSRPPRPPGTVSTWWWAGAYGGLLSIGASLGFWTFWAWS